MSAFIYRRAAQAAILAVSVLAVSACVEIGPGGAESKIGVGPFKAYSLEAGPGGVEEKGPSAGPLKAQKEDSE